MTKPHAEMHGVFYYVLTQCKCRIEEGIDKQSANSTNSTSMPRKPKLTLTLKKESTIALSLMQER